VQVQLLLVRQQLPKEDEPRRLLVPAEALGLSLSLVKVTANARQYSYSCGCHQHQITRLSNSVPQLPVPLQWGPWATQAVTAVLQVQLV
jgi:hypothetical protein